MPALSISIAGLGRDQGRPWFGSPKRAISWVASIGSRFVQLDAAHPAFRARDLDRSGRRDLAASIRRAGLVLSGLDLWIPSEHFLDPTHQGRAVDAVSGAIMLAADLSALNRAVDTNVSVTMPPDAPRDVASLLEREAEQAGVRLANCAYPATGNAVGVDPAVALMAGDDPVDVIGSLGGRVASARLSDADDAGRVPVGEGKLEVGAYLASIDVVCADLPVIIDVRGLGDLQDRAARVAIELSTA